MSGIQEPQRIETVVIGGGQAGLSVGYGLAKKERPFVILDASARVGDAWRNRWDSLRLFTPARYDGLKGMRFPAKGGSFPTKDEMADYLESYAQRFDLPVHTGTKVDSLSKRGDHFIVRAGGSAYEADNVVIAMANYQRPRVPIFAKELDPGIVQLHSSEYHNASQLRDGNVLLVGVGNSGADIAIDVARTHKTLLAGKESGHVPFPIEAFIGRNVLVRLVRFVGHHILTIKTPIGRRLRPKMVRTASPLIRVKPKDLAAAGVEQVERITGVRDGMPLAGDRVLDVQNIIWCTGYQPGFSWIDLPVFDAEGDPMQIAGSVPSQPGLYFVGLHFLYSMTSDTITGMRRDAARVVRKIAGGRPSGARAVDMLAASIVP